MSERAQAVCPGTRICCPTCGGAVLYTDMRSGDGFFCCQRKVGEGFERRTCGQHMYVLCTDRLCTVLALTREERHRFDAGHYTPPQILAELGVRIAGATLLQAVA